MANANRRSADDPASSEQTPARPSSKAPSETNPTGTRIVASRPSTEITIKKMPSQTPDRRSIGPRFIASLTK